MMKQTALSSPVARSGFTLIEIMIVISIIGILSAMAVPHFQRARATAAEKKCWEFSSLLSRTAELYYIDKKGAAKNISDLAPYLGNNRIPSCPKSGIYRWIPGTESGELVGQKVECSIHGSASSTFGAD